MYCRTSTICFLNSSRFCVGATKNDYQLISFIRAGKNKKELILKTYRKKSLAILHFLVSICDNTQIKL